MKTLQQQFDAITLIKIFEIEVINKATQTNDYIIFNISIEGNNLIAQHEATTEAEKQSNKVAFVFIEMDEDFSIDENLSNLHTACIDKIMQSEFFSLAN